MRQSVHLRRRRCAGDRCSDGGGGQGSAARPVRPRPATRSTRASGSPGSSPPELGAEKVLVQEKRLFRTLGSRERGRPCADPETARPMPWTRRCASPVVGHDEERGDELGRSNERIGGGKASVPALPTCCATWAVPDRLGAGLGKCPLSTHLGHQRREIPSPGQSHAPAHNRLALPPCRFGRRHSDCDAICRAP